MRIGCHVFRVMLADATKSNTVVVSHQQICLSSHLCNSPGQVFLAGKKPPMHSLRDPHSFHLLSLSIARPQSSLYSAGSGETEWKEAHPFFCSFSLWVPSVTSTQVPLCQMAHLIARDSWKSTIVMSPGRRGNWFGKWLSSFCCGLPTLPSPIQPLSFPLPPLPHLHLFATFYSSPNII